MKKVLVALAPGFEEIETITVVDILRRAGARVVLAATEEGSIEGSRGVSVLPDTLIEQVDDRDFDLLVLPGGQPGTDNLQKNERIKAIIQNMYQSRKPVAAICAAPTILHSAGILKNTVVTSHPSVKDQLNGIEYSEERVVVDGNIVTSRSPGTALEFALKLVEILFGRDRRDTVNQGVMARL
ncbi:MAG: DJ-1/PfpI family protein [Nitrospinota bacterium]|nr:DJ-1/PfpI family protein [Nitrospinota bacterium]